MRIALAPEAISHIKKLVKEHNLDGHVVRIGLSAEDYSYTLDIVDDPSDQDRTFDFEGVKVVCDPRTWLYLEDATTIGFSEAQGGFTFSPPSVKR